MVQLASLFTAGSYVCLLYFLWLWVMLACVTLYTSHSVSGAMQLCRGSWHASQQYFSNNCEPMASPHLQVHFFFFFFSTSRSIPVEKCSLKVIKSSIYRTVPPETASVFTTAVKMQSENVTVTFVCTEHIYKSWKHFSHTALLDGKNVILEDYSYYILRSTIVHKSDWQKRCHERRCAQAQV